MGLALTWYFSAGHVKMLPPGKRIAGSLQIIGHNNIYDWQTRPDLAQDQAAQRRAKIISAQQDISALFSITSKPKNGKIGTLPGMVHLYHKS